MQGLMQGLACFAATEEYSRGRIYQDDTPSLRNQFQRDRDRILHSSAFRRLEYKTQVFVNHEGDMFRTRLTHSLEVSQIGRTIARSLNLNEDLTEAICLAHDLGHTPFGHAGQEVLNNCMKGHGGFEHNLQSLRVVDFLEERYAGFPGLNLLFETREGILKHCSKINAEKLGELGMRFLTRAQPGLEAQVANIADEIAYNNHDVDDGLRADLITMEQLNETRLFREQHDYVLSRWPDINGRRKTWNGGQYYGKEKESGVFEALVQLRIETLTGYGVAKQLEDTVADPAERTRRMRAMATQWAEEFDANTLIVLRQAAINFDARPDAGNIRAPMLYALSRSDALFGPAIAPGTIDLLTKAGVDARYLEIDSDYGHRGPSVDWRKWAPQLEAFLTETCA